MGNTTDFVIKDGILKKYTGTDKFVTIPEGVKIIGPKVFYKNNSIESIIVLEGVIEIKKECFAECRSLRHISLPDSLATIGSDTFAFCVKLEKLIIPENVVSNHFDLVLHDCWNLKELELPCGITVKENKYWFDGGWLCLNGCNKLTSIVCPSIPVEKLHEKRRFAATIGYITNTDKFTEQSIAESYKNHFIKCKKRFLPEILLNDIVKGIKLLAESQKISKKEIDATYLEPAIAASAMQCIAFLLKWKKENMEINDDLSIGVDCAVQKSTSKSKSSDIDADTLDERSMKKLWRFELKKNNTIRLLGYKGEEKMVIVPNRIGKYSVASIAPGAFRGVHRRGSNKTERAISQILSIEVMDGIKEIPGRTFCWCTNLKTIKLPKSVKKISAYKFDDDKNRLKSDWAFVDCPNLTIHAPAGSYAEQYAKENHIPFVAEE